MSAKQEEMGQIAVPTVSEFSKSRDFAPLLTAIDSDALPGQPRVCSRMLEAALRGEAEVDRNWWAALSTVRTYVARRDDEVLGGMSLAESKDGHGYLLWLHARENPVSVGALLDRAVLELGAVPVRAFWFATPLTLGVEGLPRAHRPATHAVLAERGFVGRDYWLYMTGTPRPATEDIAKVFEEKAERAWMLTVTDGQQEIAVAHIALGTHGIGAAEASVLWWMSVDEGHRGRGIGKRLLDQALSVLHAKGARRVVLYVDHDNPRERSREAAIHLYQKARFEVSDHLWSYERAVPACVQRLHHHAGRPGPSTQRNDGGNPNGCCQ